MGMKEKAELGPAEGSVPGDPGCHVSSTWHSAPSSPFREHGQHTPVQQVCLALQLPSFPTLARLSCPLPVCPQTLRVFLHPCHLSGPLSGSTSPPSQPLAQWSLAPVPHTNTSSHPVLFPVIGRELLREGAAWRLVTGPGPHRSWLTEQVVRNGGRLPRAGVGWSGAMMVPV